jgi:hypothetical protein
MFHKKNKGILSKKIIALLLKVRLAAIQAESIRFFKESKTGFRCTKRLAGFYQELKWLKPT